MSPLALYERLGLRDAAGEDRARLDLCRRPLPSATAFRAEVERIAASIGCDADALARVLSDPAFVGADGAA